ncbi:hypothetical protein EMGR_005498 [Emarellia grisea]
MDIPLGSFDRFIVYKTWKHDDSVIYHLATWTNITAYFTNLLFPSCKVTVIFLKVQLPEYPDAFNALGDEGVELSDNVKYGLDDDIGTELKQKIEMWNSVSSADIKQFCDKHIDQVEVGIQEAGYFRIHQVSSLSKAKNDAEIILVLFRARTKELQDQQKGLESRHETQDIPLPELYTAPLCKEPSKLLFFAMIAFQHQIEETISASLNETNMLRD